MRAAAREQRRPQVKTDTTVMKSVTLELAGDAGVPNPEELVPWTRSEKLRCLWYRLRLTVHEMNYSTRRLAELRMRLPP
jgi:hypothetical protein